MDMLENWERLADLWEQRAVAGTDEYDPYGIVTMDAVPLDDGMSILDVGCGPGVTTVELAERAGPNAHVTGVDLSPAMIRHARQRRQRTVMSGLITPDNVELVVADVERDDLGTGHDVVFSQFGLMFFTEPEAGFANLARSLKDDGWLSFVAWAGLEHNPWMPLPAIAAAGILDVALEAPDDGPGPFSLADVDKTRALVTNSGFDISDVIDVTQPRRIRHRTEHDWISLALQIGPTADAFDSAPPDRRDEAINAVVNAMAPYREAGPTGDWLIPSHARVFVARRR